MASGVVFFFGGWDSHGLATADYARKGQARYFRSEIYREKKSDVKVTTVSTAMWPERKIQISDDLLKGLIETTINTEEGATINNYPTAKAAKAPSPGFRGIGGKKLNAPKERESKAPKKPKNPKSSAEPSSFFSVSPSLTPTNLLSQQESSSPSKSPQTKKPKSKSPKSPKAPQNNNPKGKKGPHPVAAPSSIPTSIDSVELSKFFLYHHP